MVNSVWLSKITDLKFKVTFFSSMITLNNSDPEVLIQIMVTVEEKKTSYTFKVGNVQII